LDANYSYFLGFPGFFLPQTIGWRLFSATNFILLRMGEGGRFYNHNHPLRIQKEYLPGVGARQNRQN